MNWNPVSPDHAVDVLNELLALDRPAITALVERRWSCNKALGDHPTCQVTKTQYGLSVGLLGVLNALFGADEEGWGTLCGVFEDDGTLTRFERTKRTLPKNPVYYMGPEEMQERLEDTKAFTANGFEDALIGLVHRFGFENPVALYDQDKCIQILMERDGMDYDGALEFFEFNTLGAWVGEMTPAFARLTER